MNTQIDLEQFHEAVCKAALRRIAELEEADSAGEVGTSAETEPDWYTRKDTGTHHFDLDDDPQRQLSIMLHRDGTVGFAVYAGGQKFHGNATSPEFRQALAALTQQPAPVVDDGGLSRSLKLAAAEQQAEAWQAVCSLLDEIRPGWLLGNGSGITRALDTIRELSFPVEDAAVAVDDVMVERATRAFMETHRPELEHSIRAALAAALSSAPGM